MSLNIQIIQESFEKAKPIAGDIANTFYENLLSDYPELQPLFKNVKMEKQKEALIGSLVFIVDNLERPDTLIPYLGKMGARHVNYNVQPEHYNIVGATLLKTFAHYFGNDWTPELQEQWTDAYSLISQQMQKGAAANQKVAA